MVHLPVVRVRLTSFCFSVYFGFNLRINMECYSAKVFGLSNCDGELKKLGIIDKRIKSKVFKFSEGLLS